MPNDAVVLLLLALIGLAQILATVWLLVRVASLEDTTAALRSRLASLEHSPVSSQPSPMPARMPAPAPTPPVFPESQPPESQPPESQPPEPQQPPRPERQPLDSFRETPVTPAQTEDWEARVGANWLNRLGALILVIGIVLFVGYSLTQLGPVGKIAIGCVTGLALLGAGISLERFPNWRTYSFSLMGAGWAILYFTAYAAHAVEAARIIESPVPATVLLLAVSGAMIGHSIRYRSETATSLAYLLGFVGLNASPLTSFSVVASFLLALSLVALAWAFGWFRLPLLGTALIYLTFTLRYDPSIYGPSGLLNGQSTLWIYWAVFEIYDLLDVRRRGRGWRIERTLFLANFAGFLGSSTLHGLATGRREWWIFFAAAALAYGVSAAMRWRAGGASASERNVPLDGGYEAPAAAAAIALGAAFMDRFEGASETLSLLFEAELLFLTALALGSKFLRRFATLLFAAPVFSLAGYAAQTRPAVTIAGHPFEHWSPSAAIIGVVFAANRSILRQGWYFVIASGILLALVAFMELPALYIAPVLAVAGAVAVRTVWSDVHYSGLFVMALAWLRAMVDNVPRHDVPSTAVAAAAFYALQILWPPHRNRAIRNILSVAGTVLLISLMAARVEPRSLTVAWGISASVLLATGFYLSDRTFRLSGLAVFVICLIRLFVYDLRELDTPGRIISFVVLGLALLGASWVYTRYKDKLTRLL